MSSYSAPGKCKECRRSIPSFRIHQRFTTCSDVCEQVLQMRKAQQRPVQQARAAALTARARTAVGSTGSRPKRDYRSVEPSSFVYLLYAPVTDQYKIGISMRVERRATGIQYQAGMPIEVVDYWELHEMAATTEALLHRHFAEYRTIGEWFAFPGMAQEEVRSLVERFINA